ncbi:hypothetical protein E4U43_006875, partial [Claviceps pusilla]
MSSAPSKLQAGTWGSLMLNISPSSLSPEAHSRRLPSRCPTKWALQKDLARLMDGPDARRQGARCAGAKPLGIWVHSRGNGAEVGSHDDRIRMFPGVSRMTSSGSFHIADRVRLIKRSMTHRMEIRGEKGWLG